MSGGFGRRRGVNSEINLIKEIRVVASVATGVISFRHGLFSVPPTRFLNGSLSDTASGTKPESLGASQCSPGDVKAHVFRMELQLVPLQTHF